jgi:hypothetical protein
MGVSYDESPDISKHFEETRHQIQLYLDSGGKGGLEGENGSNSRKKEEADFESVA